MCTSSDIDEQSLEFPNIWQSLTILIQTSEGSAEKCIILHICTYVQWHWCCPFQTFQALRIQDHPVLASHLRSYRVGQVRWCVCQSSLRFSVSSWNRDKKKRLVVSNPCKVPPTKSWMTNLVLKQPWWRLGIHHFLATSRDFFLSNCLILWLWFLCETRICHITPDDWFGSTTGGLNIILFHDIILHGIASVSSPLAARKATIWWLDRDLFAFCTPNTFLQKCNCHDPDIPRCSIWKSAPIPLKNGPKSLYNGWCIRVVNT